MQLDILYQDQDYIAIHKPSGLLVHRTDLDLMEMKATVQIIRDQLKAQVYPVHRLDRATSGVLVFARSSLAARQLSQAFLDQAVEKKYWAIVRGHLKEEIFLDYALPKVFAQMGQQKKQSAQTYFKPLSFVEIPFAVDRYPTSRYSLVEVRPITGRSHQIRRHLKHLNHPILGDVNYGQGKHNLFLRQKFNITRLLLACVQISFTHPRTGVLTHVKCDLANDFKQALQHLGFSS